MNKRIFLSPPHMSGRELQLIAEAFESNYIAPLGPQVDAFEQEFAAKTGIPHTLALSSGTAALHLALHQLGIGSGDEIMASTLTFIGSVSPIKYVGAQPVFVDADRATWNMNPELLAVELARRAKKNRLPKAVLPTDLYGQCADLDRILDICRPYDIPVVVDAAEAVGATYKGRSAGAGANAAVFSFNGNKIMTTSGGGMLASGDADFIERARFFSQQARDPAPHYQHSHIGFNYRMSNILAAIGSAQLKVLDDRIKSKHTIFKTYKKYFNGISGIEFMPEATYGVSTRWLTVILISPEEFGADREVIRQALEDANIEARPVWKPMHLQPVFSDSTCLGGEVAEDLFRRGLCLPSGTTLTDEDLNKIVTIILNCRRG